MIYENYSLSRGGTLGALILDVGGFNDKEKCNISSLDEPIVNKAKNFSVEHFEGVKENSGEPLLYYLLGPHTGKLPK